MPLSLLERTVVDNPYVPQLPTEPQIRFLRLECLEALYGGAAGGGKSSALLMAALQFVDVPGYSALIMRRTFADLKLPGALIDRAHEWLSGTGAWYNAQEHRWRFPSGATIQFAYCEAEHDVHRYQGSEFQFLGLDEATQFSQYQLTYLFSRLRRRIEIPVPPRVRLASNPGGPGHAFIKDRFGIGRRPSERAPEVVARVFVPAKLADNPHVDAEQYRKALAELDPVTRAQLEDGNWDAVASGRFNRETLTRQRYRVVNNSFVFPDGRRINCDDCPRILTCDPASTAEGVRKRGDPDYTVVSTWAITPPGNVRELLWLDCHRFRLEIPDIVPQIQQVYSQYSPAYVAIEAVASNRAVLQLAQRTGMIVREVSPRGQDKLVRATPAMLMLEAGRAWLPERAHWLDDAITELLTFSGDGKTHDDQVDAFAYACALLEEFDNDGGGARPMSLSGPQYHHGRRR